MRCLKVTALLPHQFRGPADTRPVSIGICLKTDWRRAEDVQTFVGNCGSEVALPPITLSHNTGIA